MPRTGRSAWVIWGWPWPQNLHACFLPMHIFQSFIQNMCFILTSENVTSVIQMTTGMKKYSRVFHLGNHKNFGTAGLFLIKTEYTSLDIAWDNLLTLRMNIHVPVALWKRYIQQLCLVTLTGRWVSPGKWNFSFSIDSPTERRAYELRSVSPPLCLLYLLIGLHNKG